MSRAVSPSQFAPHFARSTLAGLLALGTSLTLTACALRTAEPLPTLPVSDLTDAIDAFERTLIFLDAPFDRWLAGDAPALDAYAQRGYALFTGRAQCSPCHPLDAAGVLNELAIAHDASELGRFLVKRNVADVGAFKTP